MPLELAVPLSDDDAWSYSYPESKESLALNADIPPSSSDKTIMGYPITPSGSICMENELTTPKIPTLEVVATLPIDTPSRDATDRVMLYEAFVAPHRSKTTLGTPSANGSFSGIPSSLSLGPSFAKSAPTTTAADMAPVLVKFNSTDEIPILRRSVLSTEKNDDSGRRDSVGSAKRTLSRLESGKPSIETSSIHGINDNPSQDETLETPTRSPESKFFTSMNKIASTISTYASKSSPTAPSRDEDILREVPGNAMLSYRKTMNGKSSALEERLQGQLQSDKTHQRTPSYDPGLFIDAKYMDTGYRFVTGARDADFHTLFPEIEPHDRLLDDFSCALSRDILFQGRLYVSERNLCFNSNLLGWVTNLIVPYDEIIGFEKRSTAGLFPNGIAVETREVTHTFASFVTRDATYEFLKVIWGKAEKTLEGREKIRKPDITGKSSPYEKSDERPRFPSHLGLSSHDMSHALLGRDSNLFSNPIASEGSIDEAMRSMILSIDGDSASETVQEEVFEVKPGCGYSNVGPDSHAETASSYDWEANNETLLASETVEAPPGLVYDVIFGENTAFHREFMTQCDGSAFSAYGKFTESSEVVLERHFTYLKALGYAIGPASTKCVVVEQVEQLDLNNCVVLVSTTTTPDVPSGNAFSVKTRYILTWGPRNTTNMVITYWIEWKARSWIKGMIEKSTQSGQVDAAGKLVGLLKKKIEDITVKVSRPVLTETPTAVVPATPRRSSECSTVKAKTLEHVSPPETGALDTFSRNYTPWFFALLLLIVVLILCLQVYISSSIHASNALMTTYLQSDLSMRHFNHEQTKSDLGKIIDAAFVKRKPNAEILAELKRQIEEYFT
ncbi:hypothetical protein BABINDRAFT_158874 [Babjeviella inositovora NRRL Y-12698]|uniref:VASt domain-containing protein n=1 Tax=Babjeviella inositovora NRRL Y-12698 TaxID=984486 RepID=A0A1E3QX21_9ASCO|nr:uncharacterized protein BABINDRAFT_158874 [Babjeviella inositovora NRRL Y-12698]ODQ82238.1 hypothetical protein BABINDRAFT_158874 [Babjeviella inositovora NRRL Y-12698]